MEIVLPGEMTVMESHDIALALQHKIEDLDDVERAFVHVSCSVDSPTKSCFSCGFDLRAI
jgi:divalent metal cation (Fe/Co/Zn/Cd) transporter